MLVSIYLIDVQSIFAPTVEIPDFGNDDSDKYLYLFRRREEWPSAWDHFEQYCCKDMEEETLEPEYEEEDNEEADKKEEDDEEEEEDDDEEEDDAAAVEEDDDDGRWLDTPIERKNTTWLCHPFGDSIKRTKEEERAS